jgi:poly(hydroxyalkanoate) depolymerase family esterase
MRASRLASLLCASLIGCGNGGPDTALPQPDGGAAASTFTKFRYDIAGVPARDYYVYAPASLAENPTLVVFLHGCTQTAEQAADGVRWNELADELGFLVVYPEQALSSSDPQASFDGNGGRCWNWFLPANQVRDGGEPATIAGITRAVMDQHGVDPARVFVMGVSAGAVMSSILGATYPDLYAAISVFAGCGLGCNDPDGSRTVAAMGEFARVMPVIVIQGTADAVVVFPLGASTVTTWLRANDVLDDGQANQSVSLQPASTEQRDFDGLAFEGPGSIDELCVGGTLALPCPAAVPGWENYPTTIEHYVDAQGAPLLDFWIVHGLGHNYVGGSREGTFSDPHGPNVTRAAYEFFIAHPMP